MIEKIIEYSIRNRFLVMIVAAALAAWAIYAVINTPVDAIPDLSRKPGHRLHRLDGPQPPGDRGPDHLPALGQPPRAGRRQGGALVLASSTSR